MKDNFTEILQSETVALLKETAEDGTLNFYFDKDRCAEDQLVRLWKGEEKIVQIVDALKLN